MPEQKPRTSADVQTDYNNLLFRVGVVTRAIAEKERELRQFGEALDSLQKEYNDLVLVEQKVAAAKAEAEKASATSSETKAEA